MRRNRDYKAEYARRIANAKRRGLSRSQARGHAKAGEASTRPLRQVDRERLENALKSYRQSGRQAEAARSVGISAERLRRYLRENVTVKRHGRKLEIKDQRPRIMTIISGGETYIAALPNFDAASENGKYLAAVRTFLNSNSLAHLQPFVGRSVIDIKGKAYPFETDPNTLRRLANSDDELFHDVYQLVL
jgi:IS30 family transposase